MDNYRGQLEYKGWISLRMNVDTDMDDINGIDLNFFFDEITPYILDFKKNSSRHINYVEMMVSRDYFIYGDHHHDSGSLEEVLRLYKVIGEKAPGSYGLLYARQGEHDIYWNKFRIFRLAKGIITEQEDTLLSPCIPTIEI